MQPNPPTLASDPRRGLPSWSNLDRDENCPAAHAMAQEAKRQGLEPPPDECADSGTLIHRYLETEADEDFAALNHGQQETAERCLAQKHELVQAWMIPSGPNLTHLKEHRLGLTVVGTVVDVTPETRAALISTGMADLIVLDLHHRRALIVDWKTGWLDVSPATVNKQLRGLAAAAAVRWNLLSVRVAIVHPMKGQPTVADFDDAALDHAMVWLEHVTEETRWQHSPKAGDWCRYCPAKALCPSLREEATSQSTVLFQDGLPPDNQQSAMIARALDLPPETLARLLKGRRMIGWYVNAIEAAARILLERGDTVPCYEIQEKNGKRKIEDTDAASKAVAPLLAGAEGGVMAALLRCASLRPAALTEEVQKASGRARKADGTPKKVGWNLNATKAKEKLAEVLGGLLTIPKTRVLVETGAAIGGGEEEDG